MDSTKLCKIFLSQAARLATMCVSDPSNESKFWKLACDNVSKAQKVECTWDHLTNEEVSMLETGVPEPIKCSFFTTSSVDTQNLPPPPSEWETIHRLKNYIQDLETERNSLPTQQQYLKLKTELDQSQEQHHRQLLLAEQDKKHLQDELKSLGHTLREHEEAHDDSEMAKIQFRKLKERMTKIQDRYQKESRDLYVEIENKHYELESKVQEIESMTQEIQALKQVNQELEKSLQTFQNLWKEFFPQLDETQQEVLARMVGESETSVQ